MAVAIVPVEAAPVSVSAEIVTPLSTLASGNALKHAPGGIDTVAEDAAVQEDAAAAPAEAASAASGEYRRKAEDGSEGAGKRPKSSCNKYGSSPTSYISAGVGLARPRSSNIKISAAKAAEREHPDVVFERRARPQSSLPQSNAWRVKQQASLGGGFLASRCARCAGFAAVGRAC